MRKKLLQNTLFAAMTAWALYLAQAQAEPAPSQAWVASATFASN